VLDGTAAITGMMWVATGAVGAGLLASGIGFIERLIQEGFTGTAGLPVWQYHVDAQPSMQQSKFPLPQSSTVNMYQKH